MGRPRRFLDQKRPGLIKKDPTTTVVRPEGDILEKLSLRFPREACGFINDIFPALLMLPSPPLHSPSSLPT